MILYETIPPKRFVFLRYKLTSMAEVSLDKKKKAVAYWLLLGVFMIMVQVVLGGITRLTGSGLSMTEWKPIMGFIPPLNQADWQAAFARYQDIAQFKYINNHFNLSDFKFIFYWEWFHRVWARSLGVVFAIPFAFFLYKKYFIKEMILPLIILFILGGFQGFIGWYMVSSGLNGSSLLSVSHIRLSIHFISALILLCYTLWFALKLLIPEEKRLVNVKLKYWNISIIVLLVVQLFYGAFMAGTHAAAYSPTWPKMNGRWFPPLMTEHSWINDPINIQFVHRGMAYILFTLILIFFFKLLKESKNTASVLLKKTNIWTIILVSTQVLLGIFTVISSPYINRGHFGIYEILAQSHQIIAMSLLMSLFVSFYLLSRRKIQ